MCCTCTCCTVNVGTKLQCLFNAPLHPNWLKAAKDGNELGVRLYHLHRAYQERTKETLSVEAVVTALSTVASAIDLTATDEATNNATVVVRAGDSSCWHC